MNQHIRRETWTSTPVYHRIRFKMLVILLMETLIATATDNQPQLTLQPTVSDPCYCSAEVSKHSEVKCENDDVERLCQKICTGSVSPSNSMDCMKNVEDISNNTDINSGDLSKLAIVMHRIVDHRENFSSLNESDAEPDSYSELEFDMGLNAIDNLLSSGHNDAWMGLPPRDQSMTATRLLEGMEMMSDFLARVTNRTGSITKKAPAIEMLQINIVNITEAELQQSSITFNCYGLQVELGLEDMKSRASNRDSLGRTAFILYNDIGKWLKSIVTAENKSYVGPSIITKVLSASIFPRIRHRTKLNRSIRFTLLHKFPRLNSSNVSCVFWNFKPGDFVGHWSDEGCEVISSDDYNTTCECDHLTHFAVLMSAVDKKISPEHEVALQIITYIGCTVSIICLALALLTFCFFRNLQSDRNTIHKNLVFSLLIAQLIFVFGINQYDKKALCAVVAGFLHYFFLASFAWMCLEGVQLYILLIEVFDTEKSRVKWYYLGGYGTPALIVGLLTTLSVAGLSLNGASGGAYGTEKHCWLNIKGGFIWAFNGPVIAVFAVNLVMLGLAIYMMCKHASAASWKMKNKSKIQEIGSWLRGAAIIMMLLGTTWIFGIFLTFDNQTVVFEYIFAILNSFQGSFIFVFHCLTNDKVKKEYQRAIQSSTCLPKCIRTKLGDRPLSNGGVLSTPNQSRSSEKTVTIC